MAADQKADLQAAPSPVRPTRDPPASRSAEVGLAVPTLRVARAIIEDMKKRLLIAGLVLATLLLALYGVIFERH